MVGTFLFLALSLVTTVRTQFSCSSISLVATDIWCTASCNNVPSFCPSNLCLCVAVSTSPTPTSAPILPDYSFQVFTSSPCSGSPSVNIVDAQLQDCVSLPNGILLKVTRPSVSAPASLTAEFFTGGSCSLSNRIDSKSTSCFSTCERQDVITFGNIFWTLRCIPPSNSQTPSQSRTPTTSRTRTTTSTPTNTPSRTQTSTSTGTQTSTRTQTATSTSTSSQTPTQTSSQTPSQTNSQTSTQSSSQTSTQTSSQTPSQTSSQTSTQTSSQTPTQTSSQSPSQTNSQTSTRSSSQTSTQTSSQTRTSTSSPTATSTRTQTSSVTPTSTTTRSSSPSPTPTPSPDLIQNGNFESGTLAPWVFTTQNFGGFFGLNGPGGPAQPLAGSFDVFIGNQQGPSSQFCTQTISVPARVITSARLTWIDSYSNFAGVWSSPNQEFLVSLGGQTLLRTSGSDPFTAGPTTRSIDVTSLVASLAGQSTTIVFHEEDDQGPFNVQFDEIHLFINP